MHERMTCALLAAAALAPLPALAQQSQVIADSRGEILPTAAVIKDTDMDFGLIVPGTANGTVVMDPGTAPNDASCTTNNGIIRTGTCRAARFDGTIPFIFNLQITKPAGNQIMLTGPAGATMRLHDFTFGKGSGLMLGGSATNPQYLVIGGAFTVFVGGTLDVARTQRPGVYNGTFAITINYD